MKKTILAISVAMTLIAAQAVAVPTPTGDTLYDQAINQLATDSHEDARATALALLETAMEQGDGRAAMRLGAFALQDVPRDGDAAFGRALNYYRTAVFLEAINAENAFAIISVQRAFHAGRDTDVGRRLLTDALPRLQAAAQGGDGNVLWYLGYMEYAGLGGKADRAAGVSRLIEAADAGNGPAAMWLANHYARLIPSATEHEVRYLRMAKAKGIRAAEPRLAAYESLATGGTSVSGAAMGGFNDQGPSATVSVVVASSVAAPDTAAPSPLHAKADVQDVHVLTSRLEAANRELASTRLQLAAALQAAEARSFDVVRINKDGLEAVMAGDYETASMKFREAAKHEYAPAIANLGSMYLNGTGQPRDGAQAIALFKKAAKLGSLVAAENIARAYDFGLGVGQNRARAILWYQKAEKMGSLIAGDAIRRLKA